MKAIAIALAFAGLSAPAVSWANHVKINCGPYGFWDETASKAEGDYVWLMNDDTAQVKLPDLEWVQFGKIKYSASSESINDVPLESYREGDQFVGANFKMTLEKEFFRPRQKKDRRFFKGAFSAKNQGKSLGNGIECALGTK